MLTVIIVVFLLENLLDYVFGINSVFFFVSGSDILDEYDS